MKDECNDVRFMRFEYRFEDKITTKTIPAESNLDEILESFEEFLKGCGYYLRGQLDFMGEEDEHGNDDSSST